MIGVVVISIIIYKREQTKVHKPKGYKYRL